MELETTVNLKLAFTYEKIQTRGATSSKGNLRRELTGKPTGDDTKSSKGDQKKVTRATDRCYNCGESGHM